MKIINLVCVMVVMSTLLVLSNERLFEEQFAFPMMRRNKGWTFLDRIKLGEGTAQIRFKAKMIIKQGQTTKTYVVELSMVPDSLWATEQLMKCSRDGTTQLITPQGSSEEQLGKQRLFTTTLNPQNKYEYGMLQVVTIPKTQTYHFILKDCEKQLISDYFSRESRLLIQLQIKNNGRDYGQDEGGNFYWFPFLILGTAGLLYITSKDFTSKSIDAKDTDYVKILVCSCIWLTLISLVFKYVGYLIYFYAGVDYAFFDFMYLFFHSVADSVVVSIFIFVSFGWTITFTNGKDFDLYVPLLCMMGLITVILTLLNKITDGAHDKYHMYDTIPSYLLVFFKAITIIIFLVGCIKSIYQAKKQPKIKYFMFEILVLGGFYILSVPLIMLLVEYIPASERKEWVFILIELGKIFINFLLAYMISYKKSGYRSISFGDQSFMQSGDRIL